MKILSKFTNGSSELNRKWPSGSFRAIYKLFKSKKNAAKSARLPNQL